jgi:hypothetical protein
MLDKCYTTELYPQIKKRFIYHSVLEAENPRFDNPIRLVSGKALIADDIVMLAWCGEVKQETRETVGPGLLFFRSHFWGNQPGSFKNQK